MKQVILFISIMCCSISTYAQKDSCVLSISGIVTDTAENIPLSLTEVIAEGPVTVKTVTDRQGRFILSGLCPGLYELHISHLQCEHIHFKIMLHTDTVLNVPMRHTEQEFEGVRLIVRSSRAQEMNKSGSREMELLRGRGISTVLTALPGVSLLKTGSNISKPMVNGLYGNRVLMINNGIRQEGQNWGAEHAPEIDAYLANEAELLKGAESLRYGSDGIGAVILLRPRSLFAEKAGRVSGEINHAFSLQGAGNTLNAVAGTALAGRFPIYMRLQGTVSQAGNTSVPGNYFLENTGMKEANYSASLGVKKQAWSSEIFYSSFFNKIGLYRGAQVGNLNDLNYAMQADKPIYSASFSYTTGRPFQQVTHQLMKWRTEWKLNPSNSIEWTYALQRNHRSEFDAARSASSYQGPDFDYYISTHSGEVVWSKSDFHKSGFKAGIYGFYQANAYTGRFLIPAFIQKGAAPFFMASLRTGKINHEAAVRYDSRLLNVYLWNQGLLHIRSLSYQGFAYLWQSSFSIRKTSKITLQHGSTWRPPGIHELYSNGLHQGLASIEKGDSNLRTERSFNFSANYAFRTERIQWENELYYQAFDGYINLIPSQQPRLTIRGAFPEFYYRQENAVLYGVNTRFRAEFPAQFYLIVQGNLPYSYNSLTGGLIDRMPAHSGKMTIGRKKSFYMYQIWMQGVARQNRYRDSSDFLAPPPGYIIAGADVQANLMIYKQPVRLSLSVHNLTNVSYRDYLNRFRYFTDEPGINVLLRLHIPIDKTINNHKKEKS